MAVCPTPLCDHQGVEWVSPTDLRGGSWTDVGWGTQRRESTKIRHRKVRLFGIGVRIV